MELLDLSSELPELKRIPGLHKWVVRDNFGFHSSWKAVLEVSLGLGVQDCGVSRVQLMPWKCDGLSAIGSCNECI